MSLPKTYSFFHNLPSFPDALYLRKFSYKPQRENCPVLFREIQNEKKNLEVFEPVSKSAHDARMHLCMRL
jgi:hypothetical protein